MAIGRRSLAGVARSMAAAVGVFTAAVAIAFAIVLLLYAFLPMPRTPYMRAEAARLATAGAVALRYDWVSIDAVPEVLSMAVVAAEDAHFCTHHGFDLEAIREVIAEGGGRGASTISQQVVKNVFLWQGRSWLRKGLEAAITPLIELAWSKRRILEIYLNVAEFDEGIFGVAAASRHYYGMSVSRLDPMRAARLAAVLPAPKRRSASSPDAWLRERARAIRQGAAVLGREGGASCVLADRQSASASRMSAIVRA